MLSDDEGDEGGAIPRGLLLSSSGSLQVHLCLPSGNDHDWPPPDLTS